MSELLTELLEEYNSYGDPLKQQDDKEACGREIVDLLAANPGLITSAEKMLAALKSVRACFQSEYQVGTLPKYEGLLTGNELELLDNVIRSAAPVSEAGQ